MIQWANKIGKSTAEVVETIMKTRRHPEQGYRSCLGILRLGKKYTEVRLEAASARAMAIGGYSYRSIKSILERGLDSVPLPASGIDGKPIVHENLRGGGYYSNQQGKEDRAC